MAISSALGGTIGAVPAGAVMPFAGTTEPSGWLLCYGQTVSRSQYAGLFAAIGTTYGVGDGSTTFALPDLRGRVVAGVDNMGGSSASRLTSATSGITATTLGAAGGDQRVHQHTHIQNSHVHGISVYLEGPFRDSFVGSNGQGGSFGYSINSGSATATNQNFGQGNSQNVQPTIVLNYIIKV